MVYLDQVETCRVSNSVCLWYRFNKLRETELSPLVLRYARYLQELTLTNVDTWHQTSAHFSCQSALVSWSPSRHATDCRQLIAKSPRNRLQSADRQVATQQTAVSWSPSRHATDCRQLNDGHSWTACRFVHTFHNWMLRTGWVLASSGMWRSVVRLLVADVSKEYGAFIFKGQGVSLNFEDYGTVLSKRRGPLT